MAAAGSYYAQEARGAAPTPGRRTPPSGRRSSARRRLPERPEEREDSGRRRRGAGARALLGPPPREPRRRRSTARPGNPGTAALATNLPIAADDIDRLADAADMHGIDLTVIGPEVPLALGLADRLRAEGRAVFGPIGRRRPHRSLESVRQGSHGTGRACPRRPAGPSGAWGRARVRRPPCRAAGGEGLRPGGGQRRGGLRDPGGGGRAPSRAMLDRAAFGDAGRRVVVIEEFMEGEELSVLALTDGRDVESCCPAAQDHKRLLEGDRGPNTGGMGAYSPVSIATPAPARARTRERSSSRRWQQMARDGAAVHRRALCRADAGSRRDALRVVEFNCRLGDPEAQVVLPLVAGGFLTRRPGNGAHGRAPAPLTRHPGAAVTTVLASRGLSGAAGEGRGDHPFRGLAARESRSSMRAPPGPDGVLRVAGAGCSVTAVGAELCRGAIGAAASGAEADASRASLTGATSAGARRNGSPMMPRCNESRRPAALRNCTLSADGAA